MQTVWSSSTSRRGSRRTTSWPSCARSYGQREVGHAGTLDPDATGVLLVGLGRATRLLRYLSESGKAYEGRIVFGIATSTLDAAGEMLDQRPMPITRDDVERRPSAFRRRHRAAPADGVGGEDRRPSSARAGAGRARRSSGRRVRCTSTASTVERSNPARTPRPTSRSSAGAAPTCGPLAADLGTALGGCAHLAALRRTRGRVVHARRVACRSPTSRPTPDDAVLPLDDGDARSRTGRRRRRAGAAVSHGVVVRVRCARPFTARSVRARRSRRRTCSRSTRRAAPRCAPPSSSPRAAVSAFACASSTISTSLPPRSTAVRGAVVTIGVYDGVHLGHHAVLRLVRELADARGLAAVCVTFDRHPAEVVRPDSAPKLLTTPEQKLELLDATGYLDLALRAALRRGAQPGAGRGLRARGARRRRARAARRGRRRLPLRQGPWRRRRAPAADGRRARVRGARRRARGRPPRSGGTIYSSTRIRELLAAGDVAAAAAAARPSARGAGRRGRG